MKKIRSAVNWLLASTPRKIYYSKSKKKHFSFKLSFITLTTPAHWSSADCRQIKEELLQPWLSYARVTWGIKNYIWKMERAKSGMIHVHLTVDVFIEKWKLQKSWNNIMFKKGYLDQYEAEHGNHQPPSIKVHGVYNIKNLATEMAEYMTKGSPDSKMIEGRLWAMSTDLTKAVNTTCDIIFGEYNYGDIGIMQKRVAFKWVEILDKKTDTKRTIATLWLPTARDWIDNIIPKIKAAYEETRAMLRRGCNYSFDYNYTSA